MARNENAGTPFWMRIVAVLVLAVAVWLLLRLIIGVITTVAWVVAVLITIAGIAWAVNVLRR